MKTCVKCKSAGPFYKNKRYRDGLDYYCKPCRNHNVSSWVVNNIQQSRDIKTKWRVTNPHKQKSAILKWAKNNPDRRCATEAKRRAIKKQAIPKWADLEAIKDVYKEAAYFGMTVDHIVPLNSKLVCGLHVWDNLQLLPASDNFSKGNKTWPEMP